MIRFQADADALADAMVVVARHQRLHPASAGQAERIQDCRAAERLAQHGRRLGAVVVMDDVVRPEQHLHAGPGAVRQRLGRLEATELDLHGAVFVRPAGHEAALADKLRHEAVGRAVVEIVGRIPLLQVAAAHHADLVGHGEGFRLVVGHQQGGDPLLLEDVADFRAEPHAQARVEAREGLVHQQQARPRRQRARQRHALLLAAGQLVGKQVAATAQPDDLQHLGDAPLFLGRAEALQAEADVGGHVEVGEERVLLEHHAETALFRRHREARTAEHLAVDQDASGAHALEAGNAPERRGLAAAARAEQAADGAGRNAKRQVRQHLVVAVGLLDPLHRQPHGVSLNPAVHRRGCARRTWRDTAARPPRRSAGRRAA